MSGSLFVGVDVGTSGCRAVAIDAQRQPLGEVTQSLPEPLRHGAAVEQDPELWWEALLDVLQRLAGTLNGPVHGLALDATSGTVLLADERGNPLAPALMYNDTRAVAEAQRIARLAPSESAAHGAGSGLAKLLWLKQRVPDARRVHTQADWLSGRLTGRFGVVDANNAMKLGYDPLTGTWPDWMARLGVGPDMLPKVAPPATLLGPLVAQVASSTGLPVEAKVFTGTTDSTAAILATGAATPGDAVTSLGSTLVTKVVSERPIFAPEFGVYSQPFGDLWLVGGGSNSGGAVLRHFFGDVLMAALEPRLTPDRPTGLNYYPLLAPGERFPRNDPSLVPRLTPRPDDDALFFQGLLEGMARIEAEAYRCLAELGAPYPTRLYSTGGGARNEAWTQIRERSLGITSEPPAHGEAAYGAALLALNGYRNSPETP